MDTLVFIASKLFWGLFKADTWILLCLASALFVLWRGHAHGARRRAALSILAAGTALLIAIGAFQVGTLLLRPLEASFPPGPLPEDPAGIIILGGGEEATLTVATGRPHLNDAAERLVEGITLARRYPDAALLFTGGSAAIFGREPGGSVVAEQLFREMGVDRARILLEGVSRNTAENATLSLTLLSEEQRATGRPWLLVTSAFHMPRALTAFCAAGWNNLVPWPVDYRSDPEPGPGWDLVGGLLTLNLALKEWIGLAAYRLAGHGASLHPGGC